MFENFRRSQNCRLQFLSQLQCVLGSTKVALANTCSPIQSYRDRRKSGVSKRGLLPSSQLSFFACVVLFASTCIAYSDEPILSSDQPIVFDFEKQQFLARGDATIEYQDLHATADEILYFKNEGQATASGNVRLNFQSLRLLSQRLLYDIGSRQFTCPEFRAGYFPFYAEGKGIKGRPGEIEFQEVNLYWREPTSVSPNLKAKHFKIIPSERIIAKQVLVRIGKFPLFYLPSYSQKAGEFDSKIDSELGYRGNLGAIFKLETLFPVSTHWSMGAILDAYSERGFLAGSSFTWTQPGLIRRIVGDLKGAYINDSGPRSFDINGEPIKKDRYFLTLRHKQLLEKGLALSAEINLWSDSEVIRDFRPETFRHYQQPDNFVEALYVTKNGFLSLLTRFQGNDFFITRKRLPEVRYDMMTSPFFDTRFFHHFTASYARIEDGNVIDLKTENERLDFLYSIYRPFRVKDWLNILPIFGTRLTHYFETLSSDGSFTRIMGELGIDAEIKAYAAWEIQSKIWDIDGLRHIFRPVFRYRYLPGGASGKKKIIPIDREVFNTSLPPIALANIRSIDDLLDLNVIRIGIENFLQTRAEEYGSRNLVELNLYQDYHFNSTKNPGGWSNFFTQLNLSPAQWLDLDFFNRFQFDDLISIETRTQLSINDGEIWTIGFSLNNLRNEINQWDVDFFYKLNERWAFRTHLRFDVRRNEFAERIFALRHRISGIWEVEYQAVFHEGSNRENETSFNIRAGLLSF